MAIQSIKWPGNRPAQAGNFPPSLRGYLCVLVGERPLQDLPRICAHDVSVSLDRKGHLEGIEALRELVAYRRERLEGPAIATVRPLQGDDAEECVRVNFAAGIRPARRNLDSILDRPHFLFVSGRYYLSEDGRLIKIHEDWPKWLRPSTAIA